ncbi:MAG: hypothetical protein DRG83_21295 [Deltaproteobacteria bacterium]|nr:MAG: hypothetical protein DRG83_21295 [Deltaproteobacteria bacterium]
MIATTKYKIIERTDLAPFASPKALSQTPIHRWFFFPHSFSHKLVDVLLTTWGLSKKDRILDPFCGAGCIILQAKIKNISAVGIDILRLSVFVTQTKIRDYSKDKILQNWSNISSVECVETSLPIKDDALLRIFPEDTLRHLLGLKKCISMWPDGLKDLATISLLKMAKRYSKYKISGGWPRWKEPPNPHGLLEDFIKELMKIISDLPEDSVSCNSQWDARIGDSRRLSEDLGYFSAVITSPPYPNRHDYTRIFAPELLIGFMDSKKLKTLRRQTLVSHVEAITELDEALPEIIESHIQRVNENTKDKRILPMLRGYFLDLRRTLQSLSKLLFKGAKVAFVVGNARYAGVTVPVDEFLMVLAEECGYSPIEIWVIRYRGNSAQQMKKFGKERQRESIIIFEK